MKRARILLVEDNRVTRASLRDALSSVGYIVDEEMTGRGAVSRAEQERPDLVVQDIYLPDMDGVELVEQLRSLPGASRLPVVCLAGFVPKSVGARIASAEFDAFLTKPVDPSRLVQVVQAHLPVPTRTSTPASAGRHVLLVDDDATQLRLANIRLTMAGYRVTLASSSGEALDFARADVPHAIVCDVYMPSMDGFDLCIAVRTDPALSGIPVVLMSTGDIEESDIELANKAGATALVPRTPDLDEVAHALILALRTRTAPPASPSDWGAAHLSRALRQLERQTSLNGSLLQRCTLKAAGLSVLGGIADSLARKATFEGALDDVLARCLDAGGISTGVLYLSDARGQYRIGASSGYGTSPSERVDDLFGHAEVLAQVMSERAVIAIPSPAVDEESGAELLTAAGVWSAMVVPVVAQDNAIGALFLGSKLQDLTEEDWPAFARAVAGQIGQAAALADAFQAVAQSDAVHSATLRALRKAVGAASSELRDRATAIARQNDGANLEGHEARLVAIADSLERALREAEIADLDGTMDSWEAASPE